jgi:hypothetical protein
MAEKNKIIKLRVRELIQNIGILNKTIDNIYKLIENGESTSIKNKNGDLPIHLFILTLREFFNYFFRSIVTHFQMHEVFKFIPLRRMFTITNYLDSYWTDITHINDYTKFTRNIYSNTESNDKNQKRIEKMLELGAGVNEYDVFNLVQTPQHLLFVLPYFYNGLNLELSVLFLSLILKIDHTIELLVKCDQLKDEEGDLKDKLLVKNNKRETPFFLLNKMHGELRRDFKYYNKRGFNYSLGPEGKLGFYLVFAPIMITHDILTELRKMLLMNQGRQIKTQKKRNKKLTKTVKKN